MGYLRILRQGGSYIRLRGMLGYVTPSRKKKAKV
jgi:hypothetical protein